MARSAGLRILQELLGVEELPLHRGPGAGLVQQGTLYFACLQAKVMQLHWRLTPQQ